MITWFQPLPIDSARKQANQTSFHLGKEGIEIEEMKGNPIEIG